MQQAAGEVEAVRAGYQRLTRFVAVFGGDVVHFCRFHVGRVADNPVELAAHGGKAVALADFHAIRHAEAFAVDARDF